VFKGCSSSLTRVALPDGITKLGNYVFYKCSSLTSVALPDGVTFPLTKIGCLLSKTQYYWCMITIHVKSIMRDSHVGNFT